MGMTNYVLLHGSGSGPGEMWFPWLEKELKKTGNPIWQPHMPESEHPDLALQLPFLIDNTRINQDSTVICHSASCPLMLSFLEKTDVVIPKLILVAPYFPMATDVSKIHQQSYDLPTIKAHCKEFIFVVSDNDPWGCTDQLSRPYFDALGGIMVIVKGGGHFGSNHFKAPLYEFPLLLKLI